MQKASTPPNANRKTLKGRGKTKQKLLEAGLELFASRGFDGVTVGELEEAVGLKSGSGSFYRHFVDKKELLIAIVEQEIEEAQTRRKLELDALSKPSADIRNALRQQFKLTLLGLRENQKIMNVFIREGEHFPELFRVMRKELVEKAQKTVVEEYTKRIKNGDMRQADPIQLTSVIQSALFGFHQANTLYGKSKNKAVEDDFIETLLDLVSLKKNESLLN